MYTTQLLSDRIALVSLEDPNSVTLPVDPMDTLLRRLGAPLIPEEKWTTDTEALGYIRKSMNIGATSLETSNCWHGNDPCSSRCVSRLRIQLIPPQTSGRCKVSIQCRLFCLVGL